MLHRQWSRVTIKNVPSYRGSTEGFCGVLGGAGGADGGIGSGFGGGIGEGGRGSGKGGGTGEGGKGSGRGAGTGGGGKGSGAGVDGTGSGGGNGIGPGSGSGTGGNTCANRRSVVRFVVATSVQHASARAIADTYRRSFAAAVPESSPGFLARIFIRNKLPLQSNGFRRE
jgi:hypothetical protein